MSERSQQEELHPERRTLADLLAAVEARGWRGRAVLARHVQELKAEFEDSRRARLDATFYQERLATLHFDPPADLPGVQSVIVVAVPRPQTQGVFHSKGRRTALILPPTYTRYRAIASEVIAWLNERLAEGGYRAAEAKLPLKLLAVRSGLAAYGKNNVSYVPGMGSFLELVAAYSDMPCVADPWQEPRMMERCQECSACLRACPSGALNAQRFLLKAERCIVFHNERPGSVPFPGWMEPAWHNCIEGCMLCQKICPEDKPFRDWIEGTQEFSEEETALLLTGVTRERLPAETVAKLEQLDLMEDVGIFPRNLGVILSRD
jgi:epoxyqueuosine reductase